MKPSPSLVLALNAGSSSIKFTLYDAGQPDEKLLSGKVERIGLPGAKFTAHRPNQEEDSRSLETGDPRAVVGQILDWLEAQPEFASIAAVGHRIVHGMRHSKPEPLTPELIAELRSIIPFDPDHLPLELALVDAFQQRHADLTQFACFDTAFHADMPAVARILPIPRRYMEKGVVRYGFHGISYAYLMEELERLKDPAALKGQVILAHLGNGASLAAVRDGRSIDTTMSFTPASGLVMSTRSGDLDPGIVSYLERTEGMTSDEFQQMVNHESGLLGLSEISSDMRDLLDRQEDSRAREAVDLFCYQIRKWIGAFAAALGGLDAIVFAGGIGENAAPVRTRICDGLDFLGVRLDPDRNAANAPLISPETERVRVRVIRTDEERMIARSVARLLNSHS